MIEVSTFFSFELCFTKHPRPWLDRSRKILRDGEMGLSQASFRPCVPRLKTLKKQTYANICKHMQTYANINNHLTSRIKTQLNSLAQAWTAYQFLSAQGAHSGEGAGLRKSGSSLAFKIQILPVGFLELCAFMLLSSWIQKLSETRNCSVSVFSRKPAARLGEVFFANKVSLGGLGAERS